MGERETLSIDEKKKDTYELLRKRLGNVENKVAFLVAMSYGFAHDTRLPCETRVSWVRTSYLNAEDKCLMVAVALGKALELPSEALDMNDVYTTAEEYARGGIAVLKELLESSLGFEQQFMLETLALVPKAVDPIEVPVDL